MRRQAVGLAILALSLASLSFAQSSPSAAAAGVPPVIRLTGTLPVTPGRVSGTFGLYREETGGDPLWSETRAVLVDAAGRYTVVLGARTALPTELFESGDARWLDVAVEGIAPQPRRLLVSVPYALKAADADTIGGRPLSAFVLAGDKSGVGADGLTYVDARVLASALASPGRTPGGPPSPLGGSGAAGGAGSPNYVGLFSDETTLVNSVIYQTPAGSIGVNTTTPAAGFHAVSAASPVAYYDVYSNALGALPVVYRAARGTPSAPTAVQANDILGGLAVRGYGTTGFSAGRGQVMYKAAESWTDTANGTYLQFTTTPIGTGAWAERMRIAPDGKVGIGTPAPAQMLSVAGTIESTTGGFRFPDGTTQATAATSGGTNNAFGTSSLHNNTSGQWNAAFGETTLSANTTGSFNSAFGNNSLSSNTSGNSNTAVGSNTLWSNTTGSGNTGVGDGSLAANTIGVSNSALGAYTLTANTTGNRNTAAGVSSLSVNTGGSSNAAFGAYALAANTTGGYNSAIGGSTMHANTTGSQNVALGASSLYNNTTAAYNTTTGVNSMFTNTTGQYNTATGYTALYYNSTGTNNVATGANALGANTIGSSNIAVGYNAGSLLTTGNNNIDIGNPGVAAEAATIRIGALGTHTRAFLAGISGVTTAGAAVAVVVDANGQLGTISSSRRFKDTVTDMGAATSGLLQLRPVTFYYKTDQSPSGRTLQYGLIAEEVASVYPELVARSADGRIETVMYQFLPPMLLNEYQKQQRTIDALRAQVEAGAAQARSRDEQIRALAAQLAALAERMATLEKKR
jgi:hypothetical protein